MADPDIFRGDKELRFRGEREREPGSTVGSKCISVKKPSEPEHG